MLPVGAYGDTVHLHTAAALPSGSQMGNLTIGCDCFIRDRVIAVSYLGELAERRPRRRRSVCPGTQAAGAASSLGGSGLGDGNSRRDPRGEPRSQKAALTSPVAVMAGPLRRSAAMQAARWLHWTRDIRDWRRALPPK